jgi:hypothetical protein
VSYDFADKIALLVNVINRMKRTYPGRVRAHRITQARANREIGIMQEILEEYLKELPETDLFEWSNDNESDAERPASPPPSGGSGE